MKNNQKRKRLSFNLITKHFPKLLVVFILTFESLFPLNAQAQIQALGNHLVQNFQTHQEICHEISKDIVNVSLPLIVTYGGSLLTISLLKKLHYNFSNPDRLEGHLALLMPLTVLSIYGFSQHFLNKYYLSTYNEKPNLVATVYTDAMFYFSSVVATEMGLQSINVSKQSVHQIPLFLGAFLTGCIGLNKSKNFLDDYNLKKFYLLSFWAHAFIGIYGLTFIGFGVHSLKQTLGSLYQYFNSTNNQNQNQQQSVHFILANDEEDPEGDLLEKLKQDQINENKEKCQLPQLNLLPQGNILDPSIEIFESLRKPKNKKIGRDNN